MILRTSVHGRFQPFHNGHLAYLRAALDEAEHVYIGVTRLSHETDLGSTVAPHRFTEEANPFTYYERSQIIEAAVVGEGISRERFTVGPFPIEQPEKLPNFWPIDLPCSTTKVDDWNAQKIELLSSLGYVVRILKDGAWTGETMTSGTLLREMMRSDSNQWKKYIPVGAHAVVERMISEWRARPAERLSA